MLSSYNKLSIPATSSKIFTYYQGTIIWQLSKMTKFGLMEHMFYNHTNHFRIGWLKLEGEFPMSFVNRVIDFLASEDVIDLYFIFSDLVDIELSEAEIYETAHYDAFASATVRENTQKRKVPLGKLVL
jgi:hypothetical protein